MLLDVPNPCRRRIQLNSALFPPQKVTLDQAQAVLHIVWRNGDRSRIPGDELRCYCPCSGCRARQVIGARLLTNVTQMRTVNLLGQNAIQAVFDDGHDRGVYPWPYLHAIAQGKARDYFSE